MKLAGLIPILMFGALPGLRAAPIDLTATDVFFNCTGQEACGFFFISGPGFEAAMLGNVLADPQPGGFVGLEMYGDPFASALTVGNTTYGAGSILATGLSVSAEMTSSTAYYGGGSASGPVTGVTGEISVCFVSALPSNDYTCDAGLAFAIINLPGLSGMFSESWSYVGNSSNTIFDDRSGSLSGTITPEPSTAGIAFAGLLLLIVYSKCQ